MNNKTTIPFGPQHPVLPEPLHLKLVMEDEKVVEAIPALGYVHRGLEKLAEVKDFTQNTFLVERICGICSVMHAQCYVQGIEGLMNIEVPKRAKYLRVIWGELHRIHSHLLWLGLLADAFGFESLFMQCWRDREKVMDIMEETAGARVVISINTVGGTRRDLTTEQMAKIVKVVDEIYSDMKVMEGAFLNDYTVKHRLCGIGVLTKEEAYALGAVGPMARASGVAQDLGLWVTRHMGISISRWSSRKTAIPGLGRPLGSRKSTSVSDLLRQPLGRYLRAASTASR